MPRAGTEKCSETLKKLLASKLAASTDERRKQVFDAYMVFAKAQRLDANDEETVCEFLMQRATRSCVTTLKVVRSHLKCFVATVTGVDGFAASSLVTDTLTAIEKNFVAVEAEPMRWPLPMSIVARALEGVKESDSDEHVRDVALVATAVLGLMRADTVMSLRVRDVGDDVVVGSDGVVHINRQRGVVREKGKGAQLSRDDHRATVNQAQRLWYAPEQYSKVMRMFIARQRRRRERAVNDVFWNIGRVDERQPHESAHVGWASLRLSRAIRRLLRNSEEERFAKHYSGHSARSGGATACFALGVPKHVIRVLGGWIGKDNTNVNKYIDELAGVTAADEFVFGALSTMKGQQRVLFNERTRLNRPAIPADTSVCVGNSHPSFDRA